MNLEQRAKEWWTQNHEMMRDPALPHELDRYHAVEEKRIRKLFESHLGMRAIEAGCGHGRIIEVIRPYCCEVHGVDYSDSLVAYTKRRYKDCSEVSIRGGDIESLPYHDDEFDIGILAFNTFGNLYTKKEGAIKEMGRIIRPGGLLIMSVYSEEAKRMQHEAYASIGLKVTKDEKGIVYTEEGLISQRFSKMEVEAWMSIGGFIGHAEPLTPLSYFGVFRNGK
ncbi:class I SAM-dependent methyltransferase [Candidatus Woesearchaeota archaeon]|nr:class I SAM-dependent methyltransferase [Candidatus Woesearchaeota archaeon]